MTFWQIIILASIAVLALKVAGYLVPPSLLEKPAAARVADLLTIALLAALAAVQTFGAGEEIVVDARVPAVVVAIALFALRVPFILVVIAAAGVAAGIRALS
ncbi:Branched-chain amino acid transport protein (AzlD) [Cryobacterium psychrotolerans]|uniref:Branched-chain amino acid transport protein (AzlD) n=1 Tax=Cryobacterium psychrotolerans TaxID=386301 RepID=A0A1G9FZW8_9MICO|nr:MULTISPECIES: AzlD domain-containing protein [Cryobacterium]TFD44242.1 AzlD domain-containing protein [Cryobacterium sp. TMT1-2-1]TFD89322.1 AzlD domain-containing protein [Cryobacterium psychrotolerans]SDK93932.1 Branched-chain amino acid transport protein (AzlD) [Cryobacterium psychrotolerans]